MLTPMLNDCALAIHAKLIVPCAGGAPDSALGIVGALGFDVKDGSVYSKSEKGWKLLANVNLRQAP